MKKSLVSALTTALVVGAASTTFAAANPFADVPADHWSYDAIAQLAADGVIEGYGDGTYRGDEEITRYEMAQMVARAMAKGSNANRALIDKLAAEFSEELNNLGVRVAALEKKVDNVKFSGELRYRTHHVMSKDGRGLADSDASRANSASHINELRFVLDMKAQVNKNWSVGARVLYNGDMRTSENVGGTKSNIRMDRMWAEGAYRNFTIKLGKFNWKSAVDNGMVNDDRVSGAMVTFGKKVKVDLMGGRYNLGDNKMWGGIEDTYPDYATGWAADVASVQVYNDRKDKITWGVGYTYIHDSEALKDWTGEEDLNIIQLGLGYKFNKNLRLDAAWARDFSAKTVRSAQKNRWGVELGYRGADRNKPGSYGLYLAYRELGPFGGLYSTYRSGNSTLVDNVRGIDLGGTVTVFKNVQATVKYFNGANLHERDDDFYGRFESIFGQIDFFF